MINSSNIKHKTSKFASLAIWLFIAVFMVTIQSARAGSGTDTLRGDCSDCDVIELELEEAYLADTRNETLEIVVDAMLKLYKAIPDEAQGNIADVLNCFDFCHDVTDPWSPERNDCIQQCNTLIAE